MLIPIIKGIYTDAAPAIRAAYPVNLVPVPKESGVSNDMLRPADGIVLMGTGPGKDRGGINWNGVCYRVMGTKLVSVSSAGVITTLGDVGGSESSLVTMDYGFDRIAIASGGGLHYWNGTALTQVTDPNLGTALDVVWADGYYVTTDGTSLIVTDLTDPTQVNPLKYGSSEADPDKIVAIKRYRTEVYAINRHTIEVFDNIGGELFPFQRIEGAQIQKGAVGTHACCIYADSIAFVGGGRNESVGVYIAQNATTQKVSTQEIDKILAEYSEAEIAAIKLEARLTDNHNHLYLHLPDRTLVYDLSASMETKTSVWFVLTSALAGFSQYRARNFVLAYGKWIAGDPASSNVGHMTQSVSTHWGDTVRWEFSTSIMYNEGKGAIFNSIELAALTGSVALGQDPVISTSYSLDGKLWSQEKAIKAGQVGDTTKRLVWFRQGAMRHWRIQRFSGTSNAHITILAISAELEALGA